MQNQNEKKPIEAMNIVDCSLDEACRSPIFLCRIESNWKKSYLIFSIQLMHIYWDPIFLQQQLLSTISWDFSVILFFAFVCFNFSDWIFVTIFWFSHIKYYTHTYIGALEQMTCIEYNMDYYRIIIDWVTDLLYCLWLHSHEQGKWKMWKEKKKKYVIINRATMLLAAYQPRTNIIQIQWWTKWRTLEFVSWDFIQIGTNCFSWCLFLLAYSEQYNVNKYVFTI